MVITILKKIVNKLMYSHQDSPHSHILGWISRVIAFPASIMITHYMNGDVMWVFVALASLTILLDTLFLVCGVKESKFKSEKLFQDLKITTTTFDRFMRNRLILKSVLLLVFFNLPSLFELYFIVSFFSVYGMARRTIWKHCDITKYQASHGYSSSSLTTQGHNVMDSQTGSSYDHYAYSTVTNPTPNHGLPGFDTMGCVSSSPTSIGGISN